VRFREGGKIAAGHSRPRRRRRRRRRRRVICGGKGRDDYRAVRVRPCVGLWLRPRRPQPPGGLALARFSVVNTSQLSHL